MPEELIRELYNTLRMGPMSANSSPARFVFVRSDEGKQTLAACAFDSNKPKILQAPVTVVIGYDLDFADKLPHAAH